MSLIYHYTSLNTFEKIVSKKTLRLCNVKFMNDENELHYGKEQFFKLLLEEGWPNEDIERVRNCFSEHIIGGPETYAFCMSALRDAFTQWKLYGDDGRGIAIGFDPRLVNSVEDTELQQVCYRTAEQIEKLRSKLGMCSPANNDVLIYLAIQWHVEPMIASFKQNEFETEAETRLFARIVDLDELTETEYSHTTFGASIDSIDYFVRGGLLVPYIEREFDLSDIKEVVIGPRVSTLSNRASILSWLRKSGLKDVDVCLSQIKYQA